MVPPHDVESNLVSNEILDFVVLMWYLYRRDLSLKSPLQRERLCSHFAVVLERKKIIFKRSAAQMGRLKRIRTPEHPKAMLVFCGGCAGAIRFENITSCEMYV